VTPATNNTSSKNGFGRSGCTIRTDSNGVVYVFDYQFAFDPLTSAPGKIQMIRSFNGGATWTPAPEPVHGAGRVRVRRGPRSGGA
jgi:hypothetical protein